MTLNPDDLVLVTGASSGIGEATVRRLRSQQIPTVAVARRADRLAALAAETGCEVAVLDVQNTAAVMDFGTSRSFTAVVNNAGLGRAMGSLADATVDDIDRTLNTNIGGVVHLTRAVLPAMIEAGRGHIVNISSTAAHYSMATVLYGATKAAMHRMCTNLRLELHGTGVRVTEIAPGRVTTEFYDVAVDDPDVRAAAKNTGIDEMTPDDIAQAVVYALDAPQRVNVSLVELQATEQTYGGAHFVPGPQSNKREQS